MSPRKNQVATSQVEEQPEYEPEAEVKALLASHGYSLAPPDERVGSHDVRWTGKSYSLPAEPVPVSLREASETLRKKADEEEQEITVSEIIDALPWDGAQAFIKAVDDLFGWGILQPEKIKTFFGTIKVPPTLRTIKTGPNSKDRMQVFWGEVYIPQIEAQLVTRATKHEGRFVFSIGGTIAKKNRHTLDVLVALARIYAYEKSIYKGKAIRIFVDADGAMMENKEPEFIKTDPTLERDLIFSEEVRNQINTNLFAPIKYPAACRQLNIPLKRGILLEGKYGVGKSMTAAVTADLSVRHGWTFIMLDRVAGLKQVLEFAHRYAPVVVFAEDIDRVIAGMERTVSIDDILNTLDGVQGKGHEIITVLTTNHADKINRALLRPGRLDAIVTVLPPDAEAAEKLMRLYGRGLIAEDEPLTEAGKAIAGQIPAVIREAVERAKLSAIAREGGVPDKLVDQDLVVAAGTMKGHLELMHGKADEPLTPEQMIGDGLAQLIQQGGGKTSKVISGMARDIEKMKERFGVE